MVSRERLRVRLVFAVLRRRYSTRSSGITGRVLFFRPGGVSGGIRTAEPPYLTNGLQPFFEYNGSVNPLPKAFATSSTCACSVNFTLEAIGAVEGVCEPRTPSPESRVPGPGLSALE